MKVSMKNRNDFQRVTCASNLKLNRLGIITCTGRRSGVVDSGQGGRRVRVRRVRGTTPRIVHRSPAKELAFSLW